MAGGWIKMRKELATEHEVLQIVASTGLDVDAVLGKLFRFWAWAEDNSTEGVIHRVAPELIDALLRHQGFAQALAAVGWLTLLDQEIQLPEFSKYNGVTAKARNGNAARQARFRSKKKQASPPAEEPPKEKVKKATKEPSHSEAFLAFWAAYPRKEAKAVAWKSWQKLTPNEELVKAILAGLERAMRSEQWRKEDGQFIPHPATWLNQRRWEDEGVGGQRGLFDGGLGSDTRSHAPAGKYAGVGIRDSGPVQGPPTQANGSDT